jgi:hypothetical protein
VWSRAAPKFHLRFFERALIHTHYDTYNELLVEHVMYKLLGIVHAAPLVEVTEIDAPNRFHVKQPEQNCNVFDQNALFLCSAASQTARWSLNEVVNNMLALYIGNYSTINDIPIK